MYAVADGTRTLYRVIPFDIFTEIIWEENCKDTRGWFLYKLLQNIRESFMRSILDVKTMEKVNVWIIINLQIKLRYC